MPFTDSCKSVTLTGTVLSAECKLADNKTYKPASISLDKLIGNVGGKLTWGHVNFSQTCKDIVLKGSVLTAVCKTSDNKWVASELDLNAHIQNNKGLLEGVNIHHHVDTHAVATKHVAPALNRSISIASTASAASESSSLFSATSSTSSATTVAASSSSTTKTFSSSQFRSHSMQYTLEESCTLIKIEKGILYAECRLADGSCNSCSIDLNLYIGNINGCLEWDGIDFTKTCRNTTLDGYILITECRHPGKEDRWSTCRFDLRTRFRNERGILIFVELNRKLSTMLSEVPWMKFKVIAEPDLSVFAHHPVIKETLVRIAETTVEHVTIEMSEKITRAITEAISVVTASAMRHVSAQMEILVQESVGYGAAHVQSSCTEAEYLHMMKGHSHGYSNGGYSNGHSNGHGVNGHSGVITQY
ncbi:Cyanovirin-N [Crucibulum laeve]|uniref:Cyanovirin-N n=1 Tax=Crucibulum laeve TaxID=68775 RepID=A0A5C3LRQ7_9AGAR|nr:Cyanovirin-N [Crucibulum laeve]